MNRRSIWIVAITLSVGLAAGPARTQSITPARALERLFITEPIREEWFAPAFLAAVSLARVQTIVAELRRTYGAFRRLDAVGGDYVVVLERASVPARILLDADGRITSLFLSPARAHIASMEQAMEPFRTLPGRVSVLVLEEGRDRASLNPDLPLAVGSAFKLAVLAALKEQVTAGRRSWRDVVELRPEWKSYPSGILQDWPDGSVLTLQTLASLMISRSDNTATDVLIHVLGRETVETLVPRRNRPLLTTRELFMLKTPSNQDLLARYRSGDEAVRREVLRDLARRPLPPLGDVNAAFARGPVAPDVEWFFTARELCATMARVTDLPLMGINPGVADRRDWARIAFKGGSEPGVLNLTTMVEGRDRKTYCVVATWNHDTPVEDDRMTIPYGGVLGALK